VEEMMACPLCNDTGDQRYWEGRWRDEKAENERLRAEIEDACKVLEHYDLPEHAFHYRRRLTAKIAS
jgi:hypothetical protein